jgi:annexin A7/11
VIDLFSRLNAVQMDELSRAYAASKGIDLLDLLKKETSGHFEDALVGLVEGPLRWDVALLDRACIGAGTNDTLLVSLSYFD